MKITDKIEITNEDNMTLMSRYEDNYFDLAIIDPPYGIGIDGAIGGGVLAKKSKFEKKNWDTEPPSKEFFDELFRVSKNQIIWGANHFISRIPYDASCFIVWDKDNGENYFADCELAWTSFKGSVRKFKYKWQGMLQEDMKNKEIKIHPTQKPVQLYKWLIDKFLNGGGRILDTHIGSGSIAIACHDYGVELTGCEIDEKYYQDTIKRIQNHVSQLKLF